jgi:hypothetical protein
MRGVLRICQSANTRRLHKTSTRRILLKNLTTSKKSFKCPFMEAQSIK